MSNCHKILICLNPDLHAYFLKQARAKARRLKPHIEYLLLKIKESEEANK